MGSTTHGRARHRAKDCLTVLLGVSQQDGEGPPRADGSPPRVRVLARLPELLEGLAPEQARLAHHHAVAPAIDVQPGPWALPDLRADRGATWLGLLVLDGLLVRSAALDDLSADELLGPGDLIHPSGAEHHASFPMRVGWHAIVPTTVAVLDARVTALLCRWPGVIARITANAVGRAQSQSVHLAIAQARRADVRLLLLFRHLADRFGRVGPEGIVVPVPLTHERLAGLVCLRRPTVSAALQELARSGQVVRRPDRSWLLPTEPPDLERLLRGDRLDAAA